MGVQEIMMPWFISSYNSGLCLKRTVLSLIILHNAQWCHERNVDWPVTIWWKSNSEFCQAFDFFIIYFYFSLDRRGNNDSYNLCCPQASALSSAWVQLRSHPLWGWRHGALWTLEDLGKFKTSLSLLPMECRLLWTAALRNENKRSLTSQKKIKQNNTCFLFLFSFIISNKNGRGFALCLLCFTNMGEKDMK